MSDNKKLFLVGYTIGMASGATFIGVYLGRIDIIGFAGVFLLVTLMIEDFMLK